MKKWNIVGSIFGIVLLVWAILSIGEISVKSMAPDAQYSNLNLFTILFPAPNEFQEVEDFDTAASVSAAVTTNNCRIDLAEIIEVDKANNCLTFFDTEGNEWEFTVEDVNDFNPDSYYALFFDTVDTEEIEDDVIIAIYEEHSH